MSDLSPNSTPKRTSADAFEFMDSCPAKGGDAALESGSIARKGSGPLLFLGLVFVLVFVVFSFVLVLVGLILGFVFLFLGFREFEYVKGQRFAEQIAFVA